MAAVTGILGGITSWAGAGFNGSLLTGSKPTSFTLNHNSDALDTTAFTDLGISTNIKGLPGWSGSFTAQLAAPANGSLGLVSHAGLYTTNLNAWSIEATQDALEVTPFGATAKTFIPGKIAWGGTFAGFADGTTALIAAGKPDADATATFTYQEKGATDNTLAGTVMTTLLDLGVSPNAANAVSYSFRGSGNLTQSSPSAGTPIFTAGALPAGTAASSLIFESTDSRTYTGDAFWTSISIAVSVNQATIVTIGFQGTGALSFG